MKLRRTQIFVPGAIAVAVALTSVVIFDLSNQPDKTGEITYLPLRILPEPANAVSLQAPPPNIGAGCLPSTLDEAQSKVPFKIRTPHVLPIGYKLQAVDVVTGLGGWVSLSYWDKSMCPFSESLDAYVFKGVIRVNAYIPHEISQGDYVSGNDYLNKVLPTLQGGLADVKSLALSGKLGVGWSPFTGVNRVEDINGNVIKEDALPMPGAIWMLYEQDKIEYKVVANMPVEDIAKIAESLR